MGGYEESEGGWSSWAAFADRPPSVGDLVELVTIWSRAPDPARLARPAGVVGIVASIDPGSGDAW